MDKDFYQDLEKIKTIGSTYMAAAGLAPVAGAKVGAIWEPCSELSPPCPQLPRALDRPPLWASACPLHRVKAEAGRPPRQLPALSRCKLLRKVSTGGWGGAGHRTSMQSCPFPPAQAH